MANSQSTQGPGQSVFGIGQRIVTLLVEMVETRLRLVVVELEEEKANLFQLFLMLGLTLLFAAFGLMSLLVLIIWAVDAQYRLNVMIATTVILLLAALIGGFCAWMGLSLSWAANLPAGPAIVLTASGIFFISVFFGTRSRLVVGWRKLMG